MQRKSEGGFSEVLHPKNAKEAFEVLLSPREEGGKRQLLGLLLLWTLAAFSRPPGLEGWSAEVLGWDFRFYLIWSKSAMIIGQVATILVLLAMRRWPIDDCLLAAVSEATCVPENLLLLAISGPDLAWMLALVLVFSLMHNFTEIGVTAAASRIVTSAEHARLFGLLAALRLLTSPLQRLTYADLTHAAEDTFPSAQYLVAAAFACLNASLAANLYRRRPRRRQRGEGCAGGRRGGGQGGKMAVDVEVYF
ncbi:uncharacterized protein LOC134771479 [Penaeus indicus]|uniref:uncharacterized protein LOC134771479 n=1 Tax=Penaeus indicus TaxID=29960 RepID=UPI00300C9502